MTYISRAEWGAIPPLGGSRLALPLRHVIIHTWAMPATGRVPMTQAQGAAWMRSVQSGHRNARGFTDIGYSWCVDPMGRVYEGRGWGRSGAHTVGANRTGHAIAFFGHGDQQPATEAQWMGARQVILDGLQVGAIPSNWLISGHRDWPNAGKTCPGNLIYPHIRTRLNAGSEFMTEGGTDVDTENIEGLRRGDQGGAVKELQVLLNTQGAGLVVDGDFGPATEDMLRNFQIANGLAVSLVADKAVMTLLRYLAGQLDNDTATDVEIRRQVAGLVEHVARLNAAAEATLSQAQAVRTFSTELDRLTS